jgi:flavin reductase
VHAERPAVGPAAVDAGQFRHVMSRLASGVTVVSVVDDGHRHGMTVNAIMSVSLEPVLMLFCCERDSAMHDPLLRTGSWAASVLSSEQEEASRWFATREGDGHDQFDGWPVRPGRHTGAPILTDALAWFECRTWQTYDGGDHTIVVGEVLDLALENDVAPLVYFARGYPRLAE